MQRGAQSRRATRGLSSFCSHTVLPSLAAAAAFFAFEQRFAPLLAVAVEELVAECGLGNEFARCVEGDGERHAGADGGCGDAEGLEC